MPVICLCSAAGAPGVTTTAVGLAMNWARPVLLVESDPSGSNGLLGGMFRGAREYESGLLDIAASPLAMYDAVRDATRPIEGTEVRYLVGLQTHTQAPGLENLWAPLGEELADLEHTGQDVIVDAGRLGLVGSPEPLLARADLTLIVTRSHLPALAAARSWVEQLRSAPTPWRQPGVLMVGEGQPYRSKEVHKALGLPVISTIADDPAGAAVYHRGAPAPRRFGGSGYVRSLHTCAQAITGAVARYRTELVKDVNA
ncbi:P-loop NTPase family protein [Pengzhenrongella sicca]|uniref:Uncharacterized protein n=1 Tax=Pengzhenrongella sicca TaxID=2819238 RepID=A0A8A4ZDF3_9MICO|nr:hypothetical protein [Pengzhenrongella sicca]QTE28576.1 hypothetical protein J4E96_14550 [Pengzhenrongella sicca]